jgi:transposase
MGQERSPGAARPVYTPEFRERAMRLVTETIEAEGRSQGVVARIARQLGVNEATLHSWLRRAGRDLRDRPGMAPDLELRISQLERENRELRRANEILKAASAFFAAELDRPERR